ncbi:DUF5133 domain-containing protein, partial [Streptomyces sp. NPDC101117]|uniref:DUF5133 domain-containing protein n=1 Tax=Streptomyces sp. NPDC101117 TaxID=3366108 RepID=UPI00382CFFDF
MLTPHPTLLRRLVDEYEALMARTASGEVHGRSDVRATDLAYTLCVSTGTRDVGHALERARQMLTASLDEVPARYTAAPGGRARPGGPLPRGGGEVGTARLWGYNP